MKKIVLVDSMIFDLLITLSPDDFGKILESYELITTDVNQIELGRMSDKEKLKKIEHMIKQYFKVISAKTFSFSCYKKGIDEDSSIGFSRYGSIEKGRTLRYADAEVINKVGKESGKVRKGRALNDQAIVLAMNTCPEAILVTEEKPLINKVIQCGKGAISFDEFKKLVGIMRA